MEGRGALVLRRRVLRTLHPYVFIAGVKLVHVLRTLICIHLGLGSEAGDVILRCNHLLATPEILNVAAPLR